MQTMKITVRNVGQCFGTRGDLLDARGATIWTGPVRPYGFTDAARNDAQSELARRTGRR